MACNDGVNCSVGFWMTILAICPLFIYLVGAGILIYETIAKQDTYAIVRALQTTYTVHLYAISLFLLFIFISAYLFNFGYLSLHPVVAIVIIPITRFLLLTGTMIFVYRRCKTKGQGVYQPRQSDRH